jgi:glutamate/tyrosine decarboxylase-like PLP-dependent enzyme
MKRIKSRYSRFLDSLMSLFFKFDFSVFPKNFLKLISVNYFLQKEFSEQKNLGAIRSFPSKRSLWMSFIGMKAALNNLGNVYSIKKLDFSRKIEKEVIEWAKDLINVSSNKVEGYITSGGSESNLFLMWSGREWLKKHSKGKILLIKTSFTHYSVSKAARILDINQFSVSINEESWGVDVLDLEKNILRLNKEGYFGFLIPVTLGYSSTGSFDQLEKVVQMVKNLQKNSKIKCFIWVDAAMQGLPLSYLNEGFSPLKNPLVQGYLVDTHKLGLTPVPSGIMIYRKELRELIEQKIDYLSELDSTLLGSRPGFSALSIWAGLVDYPQNKLKNRFSYLNQQKEDWLKVFKNNFPKANIISNKYSLTVGIAITTSFPRLHKSIEEKYGLFPAKIKFSNSSHKSKTLNHYKILFLSRKQDHMGFLEEIKPKKKNL